MLPLFKKKSKGNLVPLFLLHPALQQWWCATTSNHNLSCKGIEAILKEITSVLMPQSSIAHIVIETIILKQLAIKTMVTLLVIVSTKALKKLILQGNVKEIPLLTMSMSIIMSMLPHHSRNSKECFLTSLRISTLK